MPLREVGIKLKRVKIVGFKTFADKTEFDLDGDLIAVVGPNGCGKSNIVDAILWGLAEPNPRAIRAGAGQDIIFSGSANRKRLGYAEVTLLFDNEDGMLALDSSEVTVSRRLDRDGESEYRINGRKCRQKDIYDLLADSGLGRAGYAIVGQKEIDAALAASPEERRAWIDEAAGVQRFRARRLESIRRLDSANEHLSRVEDIVREIETQREPLREEAELASAFKSASKALREIQVNILILDLERAVRDVGDAHERALQSQNLSAREQKIVNEQELTARRIGEQLSETERHLDANRELQQAAFSRIERAQSSVELNVQKLTGLDDLEASLRDELGNQTARRLQAQADREEVAIELGNEVAVRDALRAAGTENLQTDSLRLALEAAEMALKSARVQEEGRVRLEAQQKQQGIRHREIEIELNGIEASKHDLNRELEAARTATSEAEAKVASQRALIITKTTFIEEVRQRLEASASAARQVSGEMARLEGRKRGLEATLDSLDGLTQGARAVMQAVERGDLPSGYTPIAAAISTDPKLATAIDTALGAAANDLIVADESLAKRAIEHLKQHRTGRATFQPLSRVRNSGNIADLARLATRPGVVGIASELVKTAKEFRPLIDSLLGRILIVENLDVGLSLPREGGWSRLVSLDGEVIFAAGAVAGGRSGSHGSGLVQRRAEADEAERQINDLLKRQATLESEQGEHGRQLEALGAERVDLAGALADLEKLQKEAEKWLGDLESEWSMSLKSAERLLRERDAITNDADILPAPIDLAPLEQERDRCLTEIARLSQDAASAKVQLDEADRRVARAQTREAEAVRRLEILDESETARSKRLAGLDAERERCRSQIAQFEKEKNAAEQQYAAITHDLEKAVETRKKLLEQSFAAAELAKQASKNATVAQDAAHQAELDRARAESRRANAEQVLLEEYGIGEEDALEKAPSIDVPPDAVHLANRLRREIRAMGEVNLGAIEAFERLTTRATELEHQIEDVRNSQREIMTAIGELDRLTSQRFRTTFEAVAVEFSKIFSRLFGGGEGEISLTHPTDMLMTGVEVEVTVPGKKRQRLELLSGGERSLAACAFLFALLKVKPSPLVILDEVDAPLDGRNVERFVELLRDFRGQTQFMLITHNPVTIESTNIWFGVTMQEPGVTTIVPYRISEINREAAQEREKTEVG